MKGYVWLGTSKYDHDLSPMTLQLYEDFKEAARKEISLKYGHPLEAADTEQVFIAGHGWSVETPFKGT